MRVKQTVYEVIPTGDYSARIDNIEDSEGMFGPQAAWTFTIDEGEHQGAQVKAWTSAKFSPKSRLYQWAQAAFGGADIPPAYDFNSDDLLGRRVTISLVVRVKPEDGTEFSKVETVRKYRPAGSNQGALLPPAAETFPPRSAGAEDIPF